MLTHMSLFSGIGGIDLAAEWAGFTTVGQCEWADYPTRVLEKHWPDVPRWRDIRELTGASFHERTGLRTAVLVSGGFPCQPHSAAGNMWGAEDKRHLWPEFMRIVRELRPAWVLGENVDGILSTIHESICTDLENDGYGVRTFSVPAYAVGAHHARQRVFIVAHDEGQSGLQAHPEADATRAQQEARERPAGWHRDYLPGTYWAVHKPPVFGMADGLPDGMDRYKPAMTALGNAVVPQQVYPILAAIAEIERTAP